jgi:hypothetical protein
MKGNNAMSATINIPTIPSDWIEHSPIVLRDGHYPSCVCVRQWNDVTPYVTHTAYVQDGEWCYHRGFYTRCLEDALKEMKDRVL